MNNKGFKPLNPYTVGLLRSLFFYFPCDKPKTEVLEEAKWDSLFISLG